MCSTYRRPLPKSLFLFERGQRNRLHLNTLPFSQRLCTEDTLLFWVSYKITRATLQVVVFIWLGTSKNLNWHFGSLPVQTSVNKSNQGDVYSECSEVLTATSGRLSESKQDQTAGWLLYVEGHSLGKNSKHSFLAHTTVQKDKVHNLAQKHASMNYCTNNQPSGQLLILHIHLEVIS